MSPDITTNPYRGDFPLLERNPDLAYLDSAATAMRPAVVLDAQREFYETMNANPLRGLYQLSVAATQAIDDARDTIAHFIGATGAGAPQIVFGRNASEMLNLCAHCLGQHLGIGVGDEVVITVMEHHSNMIPWQQLCAKTGATLRYLYPNPDGSVTDQQIADAIGERTKIVSCCHVSNVLGSVTPVRGIADRAHEVGALCVVDAAQSVPHLRVSVDELGCDLMAFSAHKFGGPMGIGVLWGRPELLAALPPFLTGGEMIDSVTEQDAVWAPVPARFEAGTQDAAGIYATAAAIRYLEDKGMDVLEERERALACELTNALAALPYVEVLGPADGCDHVGSVSFAVDGIHPHDVASLLDMKGVAIRAGHHCAQPLLTWLGHESTCRASVAFYNDVHDIEHLVDGLNYVWSVFHG